MLFAPDWQLSYDIPVRMPLSDLMWSLAVSSRAYQAPSNSYLLSCSRVDWSARRSSLVCDPIRGASRAFPRITAQSVEDRLPMLYPRRRCNMPYLPRSIYLIHLLSQLSDLSLFLLMWSIQVLVRTIRRLSWVLWHRSANQGWSRISLREFAFAELRIQSWKWDCSSTFWGRPWGFKLSNWTD